MNLDVNSLHASVSLNPFLLGRLKYAMMTVAQFAILFLARVKNNCTEVQILARAILAKLYHDCGTFVPFLYGRNPSLER